MEDVGAPGLGDKRGITRRSLMRGTAWAAPALAVAVAAPAHAVSGLIPPEPSFNWSTDCKSSGNSGKGCGKNKSYQVEVTVTNTSPTPHILWFFDYTVDGTSLGLYGLYEVGTAINCGGKVPDPAPKICKKALPSTGFGILVPAGGTIDIWVVSNTDNSSGGTIHSVPWEWINAVTCQVDASGTSTSTGTELFPPCS